MKKLLSVFALGSAVAFSPVAFADDDYDDDDYRPAKSSVVSHDRDDDDDDDDRRAVRTTTPKVQQRQVQATAKKANYITRERARQIARAQVKNSRVTKVDFDDDDNNVAVYKVDVRAGKQKYEVKINAVTGKVISTERDD